MFEEGEKKGKKEKKILKEPVRKVLHQDGASWNVTKLCGRHHQEIKLRLKSFHPINTTSFAPRGQSKDKLIKSDSTRPTVVAATAAAPRAFIFVVFVVAVVALTTTL